MSFGKRIAGALLRGGTLGCGRGVVIVALGSGFLTIFILFSKFRDKFCEFVCM